MNYLRNHEMFQDVKIFQGTKLVDDRGIFRKPFFGDDLVEILGEIKDEYDNDLAEAELENPGSFLVAGRLNFEEVFDATPEF